MKKSIRNWLLKVSLIVVISAFIVGYLLPLLISGDTLSVLVGIGTGILFIIAIVFETFELLAEIREILENKK